MSVNKVTIDATTAGNLNSLSGELRIDGDVTIAPDTSVTSGKIDSLTATDKFAVPLGETNNRENTPEAGTTRFNQDFGTLEFFDGVDWKTVNSYARYHGGGGGRGVIVEVPFMLLIAKGWIISISILLVMHNTFGDLVNTGHLIHGCCGSSNSWY